MVQIGDRENFPEINAAVVGKKAKEIAEASVKYPDDAGELVGSQTTFKFFILEVKERKLPEVDDEFAKDLGFENLAKMRDKIAEDAGQEAEHMMQDKKEDQIFKQLLDLHPFDPPPSMVQERTRYLMSRFRLPQTEETIKELEPKAVEHVKLDLIIEAIADKEEIEVTDEELDKWFEDRAARIGIPAIQAKALWKKEVARDEARRRKTIDFLLECAAGGGLLVHPDSD
jgi:trigger factor